jgi:hypothetical protein
MREADPGFPRNGGRRAGWNKTFSSLVEMAIAPLRASCHRQSSMGKNYGGAEPPAMAAEACPRARSPKRET